MRVLVTGATGFLGSHIAAALHDAGHDVRLLVRTPAKLATVPTLAGAAASGALDVVAGDVVDPAACAAAVSGCDAVVHAAGVVAVDVRRADEVRATNVVGTRNVVTAALDAGAARVVYVSSVSVFGHDRRTIDLSTPVATPAGAYAASKVEAERWLRAQQDASAPIVLTYPGGIHGPDPPVLTASHRGVCFWVRTPPALPGGTAIVDVRDLAVVHGALVTEPDPPGRVMLAGHNVSWDDVAASLTRVTGRSALRVRLPGAAFRFAGRVGDLSQRVWPRETIWSWELMDTATRQPMYDNGPTFARYGEGVYRPIDETLRDEIAWLVAAGEVSPKLAGTAAP